MAKNVHFEDGQVRITDTEASFGRDTYRLSDIGNVEGYYRRSAVVWIGLAIALVGVLLIVAKAVLLQYDEGWLYQFLNIISLPMVGIGAALFVFTSKYAIRLQTASGPVEVLAVRNRAYAQKIIDALGAALRGKAQPAAPTPAPRAGKKQR